MKKKTSTLHSLSLSPVPYNAHLAFSVDSYDSTTGFMHSSDKDGLPTDAVHVDTSAGLKVIQVNVAKLGDQVHNIMLSTHLQKMESVKG